MAKKPQTHKKRVAFSTKIDIAQASTRSTWITWYLRQFRGVHPKQCLKLLISAMTLSILFLLLVIQRMSKDDELYQSHMQLLSQCDVIFIEVSEGPLVRFDARHACSVESAALHHPNRTVCLGFAFDQSPKLKASVERVSGIANLKIVPLDLDFLFRGTPLGSWWNEEFKYSSGPWKTIHLSDAARLAFLYKFGGLYLDLDTLVLRPFYDLAENFVGIQFFSKDDGVNSAVLKFQEPAHPFVNQWIFAVPGKYVEGDRTTIGPNLITELIIPYCQMDVPESLKSLKALSNKYCDFNLKVLAPEAFYVIPWPDWKRYFTSDEAEASTLMKVLSKPNVYALHSWNALSGPIDLESISMRSPYMEMAKLNCPTIYANEFLKPMLDKSKAPSL